MYKIILIFVFRKKVCDIMKFKADVFI